MTKTEIKANEIASLIMRDGHHEKTAENQKNDLAKAALEMASYEVTTIEVLQEQIAALKKVIKKQQDDTVKNADEFFRMNNELKKVKHVLTKHYNAAAGCCASQKGIERNTIAEIMQELGFKVPSTLNQCTIFQPPQQ